MTPNREDVLRWREGAVAALTDCMAFGILWDDEERRRQAVIAAARLFPLPTRTVPTVRQGPRTYFYRVMPFITGVLSGGVTVMRYGSKEDARNGYNHLGINWHPEDQPTVAALLALPLTEEVEDTGEEGDK